MNKITITIFLMATVFSVHAQESAADKQDKPSIYWLFHNNYKMATRYNDFGEAKTALYSLINIDPDNDSIRFNLAYLYFDAQQYPSSIMVTLDIINRNPKHAAAIELSAIAYDELGLKEKALVSYEKLYLLTDNLETLYKLTYIQYELKRYMECDVNLDILLSNAEIDSKTMVFQVNDNIQKEFPLKSAILNLRGLVRKDLGDIEGAREDFESVLAVSPDFIFATNNLTELDK